ncbi:putative E3 ubiquitin protein ligase DRIPH [Cardamine amara subsp. amara]|uniref:E3 ubiquitin protein ligase DRIPH n=1 Tax=Cardamine amara subsp. amara TaxID=228776 RepID=A0ABD0ZDE2_CARAN
MILKIEKKEMKESFTCPLCTSLFDRPTTISECLHSFCRICIDDKLLTEKLKACPICKVDLGVFPFDKLRPDYNLESRMLKLFPLKQETVEATNETIETFFKSSTKKGKSLSSILDPSSRLSITPDLNLDAPLEPDMLVVKKASEQVEAVPSILRLSKPMKTFQKRQRKTSKPKPFKFNIDLNIGLDNEWDEAGTSQGYMQMENNLEKDNEMIPRLSGLTITPPVLEVNQNVILISSDGETEEDYVKKQKNDAEESQDCAASKSEKVSIEKQKSVAEENQEGVIPSSGKKSGKKEKQETDFAPRLLRPRKGRTVNLGASSSQAAITVEPEKNNAALTMNSTAATSEAAIPVEVERNITVWFSLIASKNQKTDRPLPPMARLYLKVTNGNLSVSHVKKYLVKKLNLESEDEVEIWLSDEKVSSSMTLINLVDRWIETKPSKELNNVMVGSSAAEFVMVLNYSRKETSELL